MRGRFGSGRSRCGRDVRWSAHSLAATTFALALCASSPDASAQGRDAASAEALFREGRALADAGDYAKACPKFRESNRLDPAPGTVFNLADCEEKLGKLATAWTLFREVAQRLPDKDERHTIATSRAAALEPRLPKLAIAVAPGTPPGAKVYRDGVELGAGSLETPLPVDPGEHLIALEVAGRARAERKVQLAEGESKRETLQSGPLAATDGEASDGDPGATRRTLGWVLGGVGAAGIVVGGVTGLLVLGKKSVVDDNCNADKRCNPEGLDAADSGRTLGTVSGIGFIAGGALLGAGLVLVLTAGSSDERTSGATWSLGPAGVSYARRF